MILTALPPTRGVGLDTRRGIHSRGSPGVKLRSRLALSQLAAATVSVLLFNGVGWLALQRASRHAGHEYAETLDTMLELSLAAKVGEIEGMMPKLARDMARPAIVAGQPDAVLEGVLEPIGTPFDFVCLGAVGGTDLRCTEGILTGDVVAFQRTAGAVPHPAGHAVIGDQVYLAGSERVTDEEGVDLGVLVIGWRATGPRLKAMPALAAYPAIRSVMVEPRAIGGAAAGGVDVEDLPTVELTRPLIGVDGRAVADVQIILDLERPYRTGMWLFLLVGGAMLLVAVSSSHALILVQGRFVRPFERLARRVRSIADGDFGAAEAIDDHGVAEVAALGRAVSDLSDELQRRIGSIKRQHVDSIHALVVSLEAKDSYTRGHSDRVARYAVELAERLEYPDTDGLHNAGLLHDIGKIAVHEDVLNKEDILDAEETAAIQQHPVVGHRIVGAADMFADIKDIILHHHERWDGAGYPSQLVGAEIPMGARILAVVDVFDALTSNRAYRSAITTREAIEFIRDGSGSHFDPRVVDAFLGIAATIHIPQQSPPRSGTTTEDMPGLTTDELLSPSGERGVPD